MNRVEQAAVKALTLKYVPFFVEDYVYKVSNLLKASYPIDQQALVTYTTNLVEAKVSQSGGKLPDNVITKHLGECAQYAIEQSLANADDRDVFAEISQLPSAHHDEINQLVYTTAALYQQTIDGTILNVVGKDASRLAEKIRDDAQERITQTETGGRVHRFNWGILSDGAWLNSALTMAYDEARIFRAGADPVSYWFKSGMSAAAKYVSAPALSGESRDFAYASVEMLLAHADEDVVSGGLRDQLAHYLLRSGHMAMAMATWEKVERDPTQLVSVVSDLSYLARVLPHLKQVAESFGDEGVIHQDIIARLTSANAAVTLTLASIEALRETTYADALIVNAFRETEDPVVDVFVNGDNVNTFLSSGGLESDLPHLGAHVDPSKGIPMSKGGWSVSWALARREDIVSQAIAMESDRLTVLRNRDAAVIKDITTKSLMTMVGDYATAAGVGQLPSTVRNKVTTIAKRAAATSDPNFTMEGEIGQLLVEVMDDKFIMSVYDKFLTLASSEDENLRTNARVFALVETAVEDGFQFVYDTQSV